METSLDRAQFLRRGATGGLALVAGGGILAAATGGSRAIAAGAGDVAILKVAATAELLAIDFYTRALAARRFVGDEKDYLRDARANERDHYAALAKAIGSGAPKGLRFTYPAGAFKTRKSAAKLGVALETAFVGAYLGAVTAFESNDLKGVAGQIGASEAQHLSVFSDIAKDDPVGISFPKALTATQATKAVTPFIRM